MRELPTLRESLPPLFSRSEVKRALRGIISPGYRDNLDPRGKGPLRVRIGGYRRGQPVRMSLRLGAGPTEAEGIAHVEVINRLTKPASGPENLPFIRRQPGISRLAFPYGTYFNGVLNNLQEDYTRRRYDPNYNFFHFSNALLLLLVLTPLLTESSVHHRTR